MLQGLATNTTGQFIMSSSNVDMEGFYRVDVNTSDGTVSVVCYGLWCLDSTDTGEYSGVDSLPEWVQGRIAVLMTVDTHEEVEGIGRRVAENVFHVIKPINAGEAG